MPRETLLAETLVELAETLVTDFDVVELLTLLSDRCVEIFGVQAAGIMLAGPDGGLQVMASSTAEMRLLELFELQNHEGPCLDCHKTGKPVANHDLATDGRWPKFSAEAIEGGFRAAYALPMCFRGHVIGALNLFAEAKGPIPPADIVAAQALADVATIAILQQRASREAQVLNDQLKNALTTRVAIEQAKGMIAEREGLDMDQAFKQLRSYARSHNRRLSDVANDVVIGDLGSLTAP